MPKKSKKSQEPAPISLDQMTVEERRAVWDQLDRKTQDWLTDLWVKRRRLAVKAIWAGFPSEVQELIDLKDCNYMMDKEGYADKAPNYFLVKCRDGQHALYLYRRCKRTLQNHFWANEHLGVDALQFRWEEDEETRIDGGSYTFSGYLSVFITDEFVDMWLSH